MNILVCVKQVPDTTEIKIDPETNTLIRKGVPSILNPYDGYAMEAAARIKDADPSTKICVVTMGPEQAQAVLRDCLAVGADKAFLVNGREFAGSDTLATSYILSNAVKKIEEQEGAFDMIFCGKQAIDGDTAQVGPQLAGYLGLPQVTNGLEAFVEGDELHVHKQLEEGIEVLGVKFPCLVTYTQPSFEPRFPTIKSKLAAKKAEIATITPADLPNIDFTYCGLKGSPTRVKKSFVPEVKKGGLKIQEESNEESARKLFSLLSDASVL